MRNSLLRDNAIFPSADLVTRSPQTAPDHSAIFQKIAEDCVRTIRRKRQLAIAGDPDAIHAMRIALTRLRAAALFFRSLIWDEEWQLLNGEFDWLNSALGKARNLDVTVEYSRRKRYRRWAALSRHKLLRSQEAVHRRLAKAVRSARYGRLISGVERWLKNRRSLSEAIAPQPIEVDEFCEKRLRAWRDEISDQGRCVSALGRKQQHRLRIESKNYRYVVKSLLDCNIPLLREDLVFCDAAKQAHQELGDLRDLRRLRKAVGRRPPHYRRQKHKMIARLERLFTSAKR